MPRRNTPKVDASAPVVAPALPAPTPDPDTFYRVPLSTAEAEATLAALTALADLLEGWGEESSPLSPQVHALRLSSALLRSAGERISEELPDFMGARAEKEACSLSALFASLSTGISERSKRRLLEAAYDAQSAVEIEYYVPSRDELTRRVVDVRDIFDESGGVYLSGYCHLRRDQRLFKLENIRMVRPVNAIDDESDDPFSEP